MSTGVRESRSAAAERVHHRTNLMHQLAVFAGLFLAPMIGLVASWLIHFWANGMHVHWGPINWDVNSSPAAGPVAVCLITLATVGIAYLAWDITAHRRTVLRGSLAGSVVLIGIFFSINVGIGPSWFASGLFIMASWLVAVFWAIARTDVARNDKTNESDGDSFLEKVGLKNWRLRRATPIADETGEPMATRIDFAHPGETIDQLQDAAGAFESVSGSPAGGSYVTDDGRADRSSITIMHIDPLQKRTAIPPLEHAGGSIMQPLTVGKYGNGQFVRANLAGGDGFSPTSYLLMGMNRTGKTQGENIMLTDVGSRRDVVILYANKAKGVQDWRVISPVTEVAVIDDGEGTGVYRAALQQIKRMIGYRSGQLGLFGIHEWNAEQCWDNPLWRTDENGRRVQMERMPFLICHFGEADAILADDRGEATYVVSKGLSVGICTGWSLQRADATKMPTGLRFNLGTKFCFGCGDSESVTMALSDWVVKAGAHPERWGQRMPGYFYFEGIGPVDEKLFPVPARTFSDGPDGTKLRDELLRRNLESASRMAKLDRGTAMATADPSKPDEPSWWDAKAAETEALRRKLLGEPSATAPASTPATAPASAGPAGPQVADPDEMDDREMQREQRETARNDDGFDLYPEDSGAKYDDASKPLPPATPADRQFSWEDEKPAARDRAAALVEFARTLDALSRRMDLRDPADPTGRTVIVTVGMIADEHQYRSRPWFAEVMNGVSSGRIGPDECPTNCTLTPAPDLGATAGKYRLQRPADDHQQ